jgi:hypothetical protein
MRIDRHAADGIDRAGTGVRAMIVRMLVAEGHAVGLFTS